MAAQTAPQGTTGSQQLREGEPLLRVEGLKKHFTVDVPWMGLGEPVRLRAVDGIDLDVYSGETVGIVGESGCGKTTFGRTVVRLYEPTDGHIWFNGSDLSALDERSLLPHRRDMQMIFQDPYSSLNPRMTVQEIISEPLRLHTRLNRHDRRQRVAELLELVGLRKEYMARFAHEFSGGQRQRIGIARALALNPKLIVADEPISALDVSIQAQVVNLMEDLQDEFGLTYMFIAHDLSMVRHISDRVAVMYLGKIVELAGVDELYDGPLHPYTEALLSAIPVPDPDVEESRERIILQGEVPSPVNPPSGCPFRTRCPYAREQCSREIPDLREVKKGHYSACHFAEEIF